MATGTCKKPYATKALNITSEFGNISQNQSFISGDLIYVDFMLTLTTAITSNWSVYAVIDVPLINGTSVKPIIETGGTNFQLSSNGNETVITRYALAAVGESFRVVCILHK